jgi:hypothetical protein
LHCLHHVEQGISRGGFHTQQLLRQILDVETIVYGHDRPGQRHALGDIRVSPQRSLDLTRFDPEPADLDLPINATQELQLAIIPPANPVAGAVKALSPSILHEMSRALVGAVQVAAGQAPAANEQVAGNPDCSRLNVGREDAN